MSLTYNYLASGLDKLRKAALLIIISIVLTIGTIIAVEAAYIAIIFNVVGPMGTPHMIMQSPSIPVTAIAGVAALIVVWIVSFVLLLIAIYFKLIPAFSDLSVYKPDTYSTPSTLVKIGYIGLLVVCAISIILAIVAAIAHTLGLAFVAIGLLVLAVILAAVGDIGLAVGLLRLKNDTGDGLFQVSATLIFVAVIVRFIPGITYVGLVLDIISWILIYVAAKSSLAKIQTT